LFPIPLPGAKSGGRIAYVLNPRRTSEQKEDVGVDGAKPIGRQTKLSTALATEMPLARTYRCTQGFRKAARLAGGSCGSKIHQEIDLRRRVNAKEGFWNYSCRYAFLAQ